MNNFTAITTVSWETRNWRHGNRAVVWCKDYGLESVLKNVYAGKLYAKERAALQRNFASVFTKKTEKFFIGTVCQTCFETSVFSATLKEYLDKKLETGPAFEMIQIGEEYPKYPKKH